MAGVSQTTNPVSTWQETPWLVLPSDPDPFTQTVLQNYLKTLAGRGVPPTTQGVWLQAGPTVLASNQGTTPLPAASLTKVATSLVALHQWGPDRQFETLVSATGPVQEGVLQGDLVIQGSGDPLLVWEEAIAIGNDLNQLGIKKVSGNLIITGNFLMNFETDRRKAGEFFKQALNSKQWSAEVEYQFQTLPKGTSRPQVEITGAVQTITYGAALIPKQVLLLRHQSLPMVQMVKLMNLYSNNVIADSLANALGGAVVVSQQAAAIAGVPPEEILLKNGSGLGVENQISPRAVCAMFTALQRYAQLRNLTVADLFPIAGIDSGTIDARKIPAAAIVKTGTLNDVSALAGVVPTRDRGLIWFAIINRGWDLDTFRAQQDSLLQTLVDQWGTASDRPASLTPNAAINTAALGDNTRNQSVRSAVEVNAFSQ